MVANPAGAATWATSALEVINMMSTVSSLARAGEQIYAGGAANYGQAALTIAGAATPWLRGSGTACQIAARFGGYGATVSNVARYASYGLNAVNMGMSGYGAYEQFANGDPVGGVLSMLSMAASMSRMMQACFSGDTQLLARGSWGEGWRRIDQIAVGDEVLSRDEFNVMGQVA